MSFRGWFGEKITTFSMWVSLDKYTYLRFHDLIIPSKNGTTQIDHLLVSPYGLFIVETKNKKGWIFGEEQQSKWTQSIYGKKYTFQNPLRQTFRQKKLLCDYLDVDQSIIKVVVFFVGDCKFKTNVPENVLNRGLGDYIKQFDKIIIDSKKLSEIEGQLQTHMIESKFTNQDHVRSLQERLNSTTVCPKCGSLLVLRKSKRGPNAGSDFLGCTNYPRCRFTKDSNP